MIQLLRDRYEIERQLSRKPGRQTFLMRDLQTQQQVIVKMVTFNPEFEWEALKLFEREIQVLKTLSHPRIPQHLDSFEINEAERKGFALVQSYLEAESLEFYLKSGRTFSEAEIIQIAKSLLRTLNYLHDRYPPIIHRDIKPSNILLMLPSEEKVEQAYLVDFGAVQTVISKQSDTFTVVGTYGYMPPEQFSGRTTPASDLYSLGATLIHIITGQHPADLMTDDLQIEFEQSVPLPPHLTAWLQRMVHPLPSQRFMSAEDAIEALKNPRSETLQALKASDRDSLSFQKTPRSTLSLSRLLVKIKEIAIEGLYFAFVWIPEIVYETFKEVFAKILKVSEDDNFMIASISIVTGFTILPMAMLFLTLAFADLISAYQISALKIFLATIVYIILRRILVEIRLRQKRNQK